MPINKLPSDFAKVVCEELEKRVSNCPQVDTLIDLFELMFFASLKTEEQQPITFHIVYLDPEAPDPKPPKNIVKDRWSYVKFAEPISATISNFIKIAEASDPRTSSLAIYSDKKGKLFIWGLIDQGNHYHNFVNYDAESGPERPGIFQASISGIGHLVAYKAYWKIAELKVNTIVRDSIDVLTGGPIYETLWIGIESYLNTIKTKVSKTVYEERDHWDSSLASYWLSSINRILLRIQNYKHGGAILITPDETFKGLSIKYNIEYSRLRTALESKALLSIENTSASDKIFEEYLDTSEEEMPVLLHLDESTSHNELIHNWNEIEGTLWFISLLSRVDGLVLMNPNLEVKGFGVEITVSDNPSEVFISTTRSGSVKSLRKVDFNHFGTRHRSMMRYCSQVDKSIGFVVSQDGDVRIMTQVKGKLIMWENIKLQQHFDSKLRKKVIK